MEKNLNNNEVLVADDEARLLQEVESLRKCSPGEKIDPVFEEKLKHPPKEIKEILDTNPSIIEKVRLYDPNKHPTTARISIPEEILDYLGFLPNGKYNLAGPFEDDDSLLIRIEETGGTELLFLSNEGESIKAMRLDRLKPEFDEKKLVIPKRDALKLINNFRKKEMGRDIWFNIYLNSPLN